ncbi:polysaccharide biosynthesis/export family protein [Neptuniibacter sp. PT8_73]|uniref:polysaccharide biosynthesis/export family protein n=1 Tax=Neptuniibacter sp. PT8_73 TaxID=3398206 RepID=UPI0039F55852
MKKFLSAGAIVTALAITAGCSNTIVIKEKEYSADALELTAEMNSMKLSDIGYARDLPIYNGEKYLIGHGDQLVVSVWGRIDLGSQLPAGGDTRRNLSVVSEDGEISLPFLGNIKVAGKTAAEVNQLVTDLYAKIVDRPKIDVTIVEYRSQQVTVEGAVTRPGNYPLNDVVHTVAEVVMKAGGVSDNANTVEAVLVRDKQAYRLNYRSGQLGLSDVHNVRLQKNDRIFFPDIDDNYVTVMGEVGRQRLVPIPVTGLTLSDALALSGGLSALTADSENIFLARVSDGEQRLYNLSLSDNHLKLKKDDLLVVAPTNLTKWNRFWNQIIPGISAGAGVSQMYYNFDVDDNRTPNN